MRDCSWVPSRFEHLQAGDFACTSDRTPLYNCIAWAAGSNSEWWWPSGLGGYYWPHELPKEETLENFVNAFELVGYVVCDNGEHEDGFEKVSIFVDPQGKPTHASRSLAKGGWTSKLGSMEDIEHPTIQSIEGNAYGKAAAFLKRTM